MSEQHQKARVTHVSVKKKQELTYHEPEKKRRGERLTRNCAVVGLALITFIGVRNAELPSGRTIMAAVQDLTDTDWADGLGKITFVSALFPETTSVFFDTSFPALSVPCSGNLTHVWRQDEPYIAYQTSGAIKAAMRGTVSGIGHGNEEERIIRIAHRDGYETIYYNLDSASVSIGDSVEEGQVIGVPLDQTVYFEVKRDGLSIDPSPLFPHAVV